MNFNTSHLKSYIKSSIINTSHLKSQLSTPLPPHRRRNDEAPPRLKLQCPESISPGSPPHPKTSQPPPESYFQPGHVEENAPQSYFWCTFWINFLKTSTLRPSSKIQKKIDSKYDLHKCHFGSNLEIQKKSTQNTICKSAKSEIQKKSTKNTISGSQGQSGKLKKHRFCAILSEIPEIHPRKL